MQGLSLTQSFSSFGSYEFITYRLWVIVYDLLCWQNPMLWCRSFCLKSEWIIFNTNSHFNYLLSLSLFCLILALMVTNFYDPASAGLSYSMIHTTTVILTSLSAKYLWLIWYGPERPWAISKTLTVKQLEKKLHLLNPDTNNVQTVDQSAGLWS